MKLLQATGFTIVKSDVHYVKNPSEYEWGIIYAVAAKK